MLAPSLLRICPSGGHFFIWFVFEHLPQWGPLFICPSVAIFICPGEGHFHFIIAPVGICPDLNHFFVNLPDSGSIFGIGDHAVSCSPVDGIGDHVVPGLHFGWDWCSHRSIVCSSLTIPGLLQIFVNNHVES